MFLFRTAALALLLTLPGTAHGQIPQPSNPYTGPGNTGPKDWDPDQRAAQTAESLESQRRNGQAQLAAQAEAKEAEMDRWLTSWIRNPIVWCVVAASVLSTAAWIYLRLSATTDPAKLAASDPWVRAHLSRNPPANPAGDHDPGEPRSGP